MELIADSLLFTRETDERSPPSSPKLPKPVAFYGFVCPINEQMGEEHLANCMALTPGPAL